MIGIETVQPKAVAFRDTLDVRHRYRRVAFKFVLVHKDIFYLGTGNSAMSLPLPKLSGRRALGRGWVMGGIWYNLA